LLRIDTGLQPGMTIQFAQPAAGPARITVLDLQGRRLAVLFDGFHQAGRWSVSWDGRDAGGTSVPPGIYFVRAQAGNLAASRKIVLLRR
jgi:flagellar hook assembly protein FlgD